MQEWKPSTFRKHIWWPIKKFVQSLQSRWYLVGTVRRLGGPSVVGYKWIWSTKAADKVRKKWRNKKNSERGKRIYGSGFLSSKKHIKEKLIKRDGQICQGCRQRFRFSRLTIDHIVRRRDGGSHDYTNLQLLCRVCHDTKDDILPDATSQGFVNTPFKELLKDINLNE